MKHYDYLIVGAGLYGAAFAYCATEAGKTCKVIDRRRNTGGNLRCDDIDGIMVHKYGPHVFHTSNPRVWNFVQSVSPMIPFVNRPLACYKNQLYSLPFNMHTFYQMWGVRTPAEARRMMREQQRDAKEAMQTAGVTEPRNLEEQALLLVGRDIYETLIKGYTEKQWGRKCSELPAFIIRRLPVRFTFDNNYFNDTYQGIPAFGYNHLISKLMAKADVQTLADYFDDRSYWERMADKIVYTGPIDRYFDYSEGELEWRSLRFEHQQLTTDDYQGNAIVNYTDIDVPYTRIIEHKHFMPATMRANVAGRTVITREYPAAYAKGSEPYYPVNSERNNTMASRYHDLAAKERRTIFGGRLAEYSYYDMDDIIERVLSLM